VEGIPMGLETEFLLLGWGLVAAILANALFSERKRPENRQPVDFWRAMEVFGLWVAALVGLGAIYVSSRDAGEQVGTMRDQLKAMSGQLNEMQQEGRPWIGPVSMAHVPAEPLRIEIDYRNFGRQPATFVRNAGRWTWLGINPRGARTEDLSGWKDPKVFNPRASCETRSPHTTVYPGDRTLAIELGAARDSQIKDGNGQSVSYEALNDGIAHGQGVYIVFGCFTYIVGGKGEFTTFCFMLDPTINNNSNKTDLSGWQLAFCPYGNDNGELAHDDAKEQNGATDRE
jgi:hypothetical protein